MRTKKVTSNKNSDKKTDSETKKCLVSFDDFFDKFSNDKLFQKRRLSDSMTLIMFDPDDFENKITKKPGKNFEFIDFKNDKNKEFDKYKIEINKFKDSVSYKRVGLDNGIYISYIFKKINNCWFLVEIIDESF